MARKNQVEELVEDVEKKIFGDEEEPKRPGGKRVRGSEAEIFADNIRRLIMCTLPHLADNMLTDTEPTTVVKHYAHTVQRDTTTGPYTREQAVEAFLLLGAYMPEVTGVATRVQELEVGEEWRIGTRDDGAILVVQVRVPQWKPDTVLVAKALKNDYAELKRRRAKGDSNFLVVAHYHIGDELEV